MLCEMQITHLAHNEMEILRVPCCRNVGLLHLLPLFRSFLLTLVVRGRVGETDRMSTTRETFVHGVDNEHFRYLSSDCGVTMQSTVICTCCCLFLDVLTMGEDQDRSQGSVVGRRPPFARQLR